jgi:hypothetical protein
LFHFHETATSGFKKLAGYGLNFQRSNFRDFIYVLVIIACPLTTRSDSVLVFWEFPEKTPKSGIPSRQILESLGFSTFDDWGLDFQGPAEKMVAM